MLNARLFRFWHDLPEALRTGKPQNEIKHNGRPMFDELYSDPRRLEPFMGAMTGLSDRIRTASGDFFKDPLPGADLITMGMILHDWDLPKKKHLIRAAYDALPPGGALVAIEALIDDARRENVFGLLMSLNMLIEFGDAFDYSAADFRGWCSDIGFRRFETIHLAGPSSAAIAYK